MDWGLRPATAADAAFLQRVYASTRADELALTDWDVMQREAFVEMQHRAQATHYRAHWPDARQSVLVATVNRARQDVGRLWLHLRADAIHVLDIAVLAEFRSLGIGSACLLDLMAKAGASDRAVTVSVETANPARRWYDRLGFVPVGELQGVHQRMSWQRVATEHKEICDEQA